MTPVWLTFDDHRIKVLGGLPVCRRLASGVPAPLHQEHRQHSCDDRSHHNGSDDACRGGPGSVCSARSAWAALHGKDACRVAGMDTLQAWIGG